MGSLRKLAREDACANQVAISARSEGFSTGAGLVHQLRNQLIAPILNRIQPPHDFVLRPPPDLGARQPFKGHGRNFLFSRGAEVSQEVGVRLAAERRLFVFDRVLFYEALLEGKGIKSTYGSDAGVDRSPIQMLFCVTTPILVLHVAILKHGLIVHLSSVEMMRFQITEVIKQGPAGGNVR